MIQVRKLCLFLLISLVGFLEHFFVDCEGIACYAHHENASVNSCVILYCFKLLNCRLFILANAQLFSLYGLDSFEKELPLASVFRVRREYACLEVESGKIGDVCG
jgi:hypothetical protein